MRVVHAEIVGWELLLVLVLIGLLFGGARLPKLARSLGQASKEFRKGVDEGAQHEDDEGHEGGTDAKDGSKDNRAPS
jgi:sec-independent protein translocase protein TatA